MTDDEWCYTKGGGTRFRDNFTKGELAMFRWGVVAGLAIALAIKILIA